MLLALWFYLETKNDHWNYFDGGVEVEMKKAELTFAQSLQYSFMRAADQVAGMATAFGIGSVLTGSRELGGSAAIALGFALWYWGMQYWAKLNVSRGQ